MSQYLDRLKSEIRQRSALSKLPNPPFGSFDSAKGEHLSESTTTDNPGNNPAKLSAEQLEIAGGGSGEKQILLVFAATAGGENSADLRFAPFCNSLNTNDFSGGRRKKLRPLSAFEFQLAAAAGRRAVFCENHRRQLGDTCAHFDVIERLAPGNPAAALDSCLLWQRIRTGLED